MLGTVRPMGVPDRAMASVLIPIIFKEANRLKVNESE